MLVLVLVTTDEDVMDISELNRDLEIVVNVVLDESMKYYYWVLVEMVKV
jgi:hypothetical protein